MTVKHTGWMDFVDWEAPVSEDDLWEAIAEANGVEYDEIADGDLIDFIESSEGTPANRSGFLRV